jgi:hypothetical protein
MPNIEEWNEFGQRQQTLITSILINYFGDLIELPRNNKFDFTGEFINIEVKSRMNKKLESFPTTMLACNKVVLEENKDLYFVFNFVFDVPNDKKEIYFIKYDKELFETFEVKDLEYFDGTSKPHYYIPVNLLGKIYEDEPSIRRGVCRLKIKK